MTRFLYPYIILLSLLPGSFPASAQKVKKEDQQLIEQLQKHIQFLADDQLEGRRMGTKGEEKAAAYIQDAFTLIGLVPKGSQQFYQPFEINEGKQIDPATVLHINGQALTLQKDFFPLAYSSNGTIEALPTLALQESNLPWFLDLAEILEEQKNNPHFDVANAVYTRAKDCKKKGASALVVYNSSTIKDGLKFDAKDRTELIGIPLIYLQNEAARKYLADASATIELKMSVQLSEKIRKGRNVIGYVDNGAASTVVLGAHFDHLGYGEDGNSREVSVKGQIHNGADDNASGTAALIELARLLKSAKAKNNNYLFVAFSGEELGLYGSKYFTANPTIDLSSVNYMINMDMVGRLNDTAKTITVGGYGTSPTWGWLFTQTGKKKMYTGDLRFRFDSSGTGPSDHTSFYLKDIPVLFYFTGLHADYHKPSDDYDRINYSGEMEVVKHILSLIEMNDKQNQKLAFQKTREAQTTTSARFSVSMGIMPDYTYSGTGVKVDGVSENKPAQKAGLKAGDIVIALGEIKITTLESYMQGLGTFKKGDKTTVQFIRGSETFSTTVEF